MGSHGVAVGACGGNEENVALLSISGHLAGVSKDISRLTDVSHDLSSDEGLGTTRMKTR